MNSRQRSVVKRIIVAVCVFAYVGYVGWQQLPRFDFYVMVSFFALYLAWTVIAESILFTDPDDYVIEDDDRRSYLYLQLSFLIALFYAAMDFVEWHWSRLSQWEPQVIYAGFALFIMSCIIRWWGIKSIKKYFNPRIAVYTNHRLITDGAYKYIRHPLYLGSLISSLSIPIVFSSGGALAIIVLLNIPALIYRIKLEEEFLAKHFPEEYRAYMATTKRILPGIW